MSFCFRDQHTLVLDPGEFAFDSPKLLYPMWMQKWPCPGMGRRFWQRAPHCWPNKVKPKKWRKVKDLIGMGDIPAYMRTGFVHGGGLYAPGPTTFAPAPKGQCSQVPGGILRCVMPAMGPGGIQKEKSWPPEIGPEEEHLLDQGCRPTARRCGGTTSAPAQYWCCPGGPMASIVGSPIPLPGLKGSDGPNLVRLGIGATLVSAAIGATILAFIIRHEESKK